MTVAPKAAPQDQLGTPQPALVLAIGGVGIAAAVATAWVVSSSSVLADPGNTALLRALFVATWALVGAYTWWWRPQSRLGPLIAGYGFLYALSSLDSLSTPGLQTAGRVLAAGLTLYLVYVFCSFPRDRPDGRPERILIVSFTAAQIAVWTTALLVAHQLPATGAFRACQGPCLNHVRVLSVRPSADEALNRVETVVVLAAIVTLVWLLDRRRRLTTLVRRRAIEPVLESAAVLAIAYATVVTLRPAAGTLLFTVTRFATAAAGLLIPLGLLFGQLRAAITPVRNLARVMPQTDQVSPRVVQDIMRDVLGDPTVVLALWSPDDGAFVDVDGTVVDAVAPADPRRAVTHVESAALPVARIEHDELLKDRSRSVEGIAKICLVLLENAQLVDELLASRVRIASAAHEERLRLERDLHDGAQQRLLNLQYRIADARGLAGDAECVPLDAIAAEASAAADELRTLAKGLYPTLLRERGIVDSLREAAFAAPLQVSVVNGGVHDRYATAIEAAVYFCAHEAMQNAVKHAGADATVTVVVKRRGDELHFDVIDDGDGFDVGATYASNGLVGMRDRLAAVGGSIEIRSTPGAGTTVSGIVPLAASERAA